MARFCVHILGCGSALPNLRHNTSCQLVEVHDKVFMVDCGEGTQVQLRKCRVHFSKVAAIFISHMHGDHCFGLMGVISSFGLLGRTAPLHLYAPKDFEELFRIQLAFFCSTIGYDVVFHPVDTTKNEVIYDDRSLSVTTLPLQHRMPCCGFLFKEKLGLPHINRDAIDFYGVPTFQINNIKNGADWITPEGKTIPNSKLVFPPSPSLSYAYCSDTQYLPQLYGLINGVDVLYHEATYADDGMANAKKYCHSTARQAAMVAKAANAGMLLLGHYSSRYKDETVLLAQASAEFHNSFLMDEMMLVDVEKKTVSRS